MSNQRWRYLDGRDLPSIVVVRDDSSDSNRLLAYLEAHGIPYTAVRSRRDDSDEWPANELPTIVLQGAVSSGEATIFRGMFRIWNLFLTRFRFDEVPRRESA